MQNSLSFEQLYSQRICLLTNAFFIAALSKTVK